MCRPYGSRDYTSCEASAAAAEQPGGWRELPRSRGGFRVIVEEEASLGFVMWLQMAGFSKALWLKHILWRIYTAVSSSLQLRMHRLLWLCPPSCSVPGGGGDTWSL
ncbi:uncharacterized protein LOC106996314 isoform X1 [Macaca mulatta]